MKKTWRPTTAGILDIVTGVFTLISVLGLIIGFVVTSSGEVAGEVPAFVPSIIVILATFYLIVGVLGLIGGIYALQRKKWGLALTGSIAITFFWFILGIPAIVFTVQSRKEFE
ncbi:hypothetical protein ACFLTN_03230 [Chloroflexota bacterium]